MVDTTHQDRAITVVLVHGAFADSSSWSGVIERLQASRVQVTATSNPLRGIESDCAYVRSVLEQIPGPVLAVGHGYGGAVISNAATDVDEVVGLVYVAALVPDEGERLGELSAQSTDSILSSVLVAHPYPSPNGVPDVEFTIDTAGLREALAGDLSVGETAIMAATQRPISELAFSEPSGRPAWRTRPSWAAVATADKAAGTDIVRSTARRAGAEITEIAGSHFVMISRPEAVTDVIVKALAALSRTTDRDESHRASTRSRPVGRPVATTGAKRRTKRDVGTR